MMKGGRLSGCHYWIAKPDDQDDTICICEGWATGASVYDSTGHAVIIAFNDRNLVMAAEWVRQQYPDHNIIIAADDDWNTQGNPGVRCAREAARIVGGLIAVPTFDDERADKDTDFNDLFVACGSRAVRRAIAAAVEPEALAGNTKMKMSADERYAERIAKLAKLSSRAYDTEREAVKREFRKFSVRLSTIDRDVEGYRKQQQTEQRQAQPPPPDIRELEASAADIIACDNVLSLFADECSQVIAGEENLVKLIYLSGTSRLFPKAMHLALKGPSAVGKSEVRRRVLYYFPPECVFNFTALSEKALIYAARDFQHLILSMGEAFSPDEVKFQDYILRELLSEGKLRYPVVQKQPDGSMQTVTIEKNGPVAFMVTTTRNKLHAENETRMLSIEIDDSAEQTRKVIQMVAAVEGRNIDVAPNDLAPWHDFQRWLAAGECRVYVPWSSQLADLITQTGSVRLRRDFGQLIRGIKAHALLHRAHRQCRSNGSIMASIEKDYAPVRALLSELLAAAAEIKTRKAIKETVAAVHDLQFDAGEEGVSVREVGRVLNLDLSTVRRRLQAAEMAGFINNLETRPYRAGRFKTTGTDATSASLLPKTKMLRAAYDKARRRKEKIASTGS
jgi:hypothetical protein